MFKVDTGATDSAVEALSCLKKGAGEHDYFFEDGELPKTALIGVQAAQYLCHQLSLRAGWWDGVDRDNPMTFGHKLALVHSEVSESLEGHRKNLDDKHLPHRKQMEVELADVLARVLDLAGAYGLDVGEALVEKLAYNVSRADHQPQARHDEGGKAY